MTIELALEIDEMYIVMVIGTIIMFWMLAKVYVWYMLFKQLRKVDWKELMRRNGRKEEKKEENNK